MATKSGIVNTNPAGVKFMDHFSIHQNHIDVFLVEFMVWDG